MSCSFQLVANLRLFFLTLLTAFSTFLTDSVEPVGLPYDQRPHRHQASRSRELLGILVRPARLSLVSLPLLDCFKKFLFVDLGLLLVFFLQILGQDRLDFDDCETTSAETLDCSTKASIEAFKPFHKTVAAIKCRALSALLEFETLLSSFKLFNPLFKTFCNELLTFIKLSELSKKYQPFFNFVFTFNP